MINPHIAHTIDARALLSRIHNISQSDLPEVRREFARFLTTPKARSTYTTWQEAWNAFTGASEHRPGRVRYYVPRCPVCHGKGFTHRNAMRNLNRTGHPMGCAECGVSGRGQWVNKTALYIPVPTPPAPAATDETDGSANTEPSQTS